MKTTIEFEIDQFDVPQGVLSDPGHMLALRELSPETLAALCDEFRANVFEAAGKEPPSQLVTTPGPATGRGLALVSIREALKMIDAPPPWSSVMFRQHLIRAIAVLEE